MIAQSETSILFFFNDTATTEIYTLSLHDALPISTSCPASSRSRTTAEPMYPVAPVTKTRICQILSGCLGSLHCSPCSVVDRKSTRLNSSHLVISYAVFCLKKKQTSLEVITYTNVT